MGSHSAFSTHPIVQKYEIGFFDVSSAWLTYRKCFDGELVRRVVSGKIVPVAASREFILRTSAGFGAH